jgi:hypothetical protein
MLPFRRFIQETEETLNIDLLFEKLITVGGKAYPKYGNIVILAGGAASGKGFIKDKLLGLEGFVFNVDDFKVLTAAAPVIRKRIMAELDIDIKSLSSDLKNAENVAKLHDIVGGYMNLPDKKLSTLYGSILAAPPDRKPNIIYDVTLSNLRKLEKITRDVKALGYNTENIHIVWVINDIEIAIEQNAKRDRVVPKEILINTHRGAYHTMMDIINMGDNLKTYMNGDIVLAFNKAGVDSTVVKSNTGSWILKSDYVYVKRAGSPSLSVKQLSTDIANKIAAYVPK